MNKIINSLRQSFFFVIGIIAALFVAMVSSLFARQILQNSHHADTRFSNDDNDLFSGIIPVAQADVPGNPGNPGDPGSDSSSGCSSSGGCGGSSSSDGGGSSDGCSL
jgi:uncharacterized membrane protein YgcG